MRQAVQGTAGLSVCGVAFDVDTGLHQLAIHQPRVILVDLGLPDGSGIEVITAAQTSDWPCDCLVISVFGDEKRVFAALRAGAKGYILKGENAAHIGASILELLDGGSPMSPKIARYLLRQIGEGFDPLGPSLEPSEGQDHRLSARETDVLELIAKGLKRQDVAQRLGISVGTVGTHINRIYTKLGVRSNISAIREATKKGIL